MYRNGDNPEPSRQRSLSMGMSDCVCRIATMRDGLPELISVGDDRVASTCQFRNRTMYERNADDIV